MGCCGSPGFIIDYNRIDAEFQIELERCYAELVDALESILHQYDIFVSKRRVKELKWPTDCAPRYLVKMDKLYILVNNNQCCCSYGGGTVRRDVTENRLKLEILIATKDKVLIYIERLSVLYESALKSPKDKAALIIHLSRTPVVNGRIVNMNMCLPETIDGNGREPKESSARDAATPDA